MLLFQSRQFICELDRADHVSTTRWNMAVEYGD